MKRLAGIVLALASAAGAAPLAFTGTSTVGGDLYNLFLQGAGNGFEFSNAVSQGSLYFGHCDEGEPCDLSYKFEVQQPLIPGTSGFTASDGSVRTGSNGIANPYGGPPGMAEGWMTFTATPLPGLPEMIPGPNGPTATVVVPIVVLGHLRAWTHQEWAAQIAPFFDYRIAGDGTLRADFGDGLGTVLFVDAGFAGSATSIPEPATWPPVLALGLAWLWRRRNRVFARGPASSNLEAQP